jgi:hypothetical protein
MPQEQIEINVVDWKNGSGQEVSILFRDINHMITISSESAKTLAFMLMECADFIDPPFKN